ncbi:TraR/DksA family transcriptional regulator [Bacteriovoracaceae bacterium]|nr:TraR/DksA family transcriptional regulator [Bacteriovoracaceae bacterium]
MKSNLNKEQFEFLSKLVDEEIKNLSKKIKQDSENLHQLEFNFKDDVDNANNNIILSTQMRFTSRESLYLKKLKNAKNRILKNDYGICENCTLEIGFQRLKARPTSELCVQCKEEAELTETLSVLGQNRKSIGKQIIYEGHT